MSDHPCEASVLLTSTPQPAVVNDKAVLEARKKFLSVLDDDVLDYKHNHPVKVEACVTTLIKIYGNVSSNPSEEKYRKVKATSNLFQNNISSHKGGEQLMRVAGWTTQVVDYQKHWIFDGVEGSTKFKILQECLHVLEKSMHTIHEKAERRTHEENQRKAKMAEERERIRLQIEDDKMDRKLRNELTAAQPRVSHDARSQDQDAATDAAAASPISPCQGGGRGHVLGGGAVEPAQVPSGGLGPQED